tara:strand:+ start:6017 stop:6448 length:432 start_codon:yes stop_codon:yes gene_type:complete
MKKEKKKIDFRLAVKAFIVYKNKLLMIKRASDDVHKPNLWELPGGRLKPGEDPFLGLIREVREETGLYIKPILPMRIAHFQRDDKQTITMIISLCKPVGGKLQISDEHSDIKWVDLNKSKEKLTNFFHKDVNYFYKLRLYNLR